MNDFDAYQKQKYFQSLDGVRCLSILVVVWHHAMPEGLPEFFTRGFLGVDMFFVLSGYLIVTLLLREKANAVTGISLKKFYIRRALRIFPVYFGVLLALSVVYGLLKPHDPNSAEFFGLLPIYLTFLANWSLLHASNLSIYWSLAAEEQFYIVWPWLEKYLAPKAVLIVLTVFIILNQLVNFGYLDGFFMWLYQTDEHVSLDILDSTFTPICLGVLLAHALHNKTSFAIFFRYLNHFLSSLFLFVILVLCIAISSGDISGFERLVIQLAMVTWLASLVIRENHVLRSVMAFFVIKRLGQISYGMYVYHMFALHIVREILNRSDMPVDSYYLFAIGALLTIFIAELSFRLYETPILSLSHRFRVKQL